MKKLIPLILTLACLLSSCASGPPVEPDPLADWLESAKLDAEETPEQLYAAALEEDTLVIYSTSTRIMDSVESFEKEYPGLIAQVEHLRESDVSKQIAENYAAESFVCDVILSSDGRGVITNEFLPNHAVVKYTPFDIADKILPTYDDALLFLAGEASVISYNEAYYPEPPINNWWELTEEKWRELVCMPNPARSTTTSSYLNTIISRSDLMAKAYEDLYGEPLQLPEEENAGREFVRRLVANGVNIVNSSEDVATEVGYPGSNSPVIGIGVSSKTRLRDLGYTMVNHYDMKPFSGINTPLSIMMAGGAPNVNSAKLFIRWALGEADGQGEGYKPYLLSGAWTVRSDVRDDTGVRSEELDLLQQDKRFLYEHHDEFLAFWQELIEARGGQEN